MLHFLPSFLRGIVCGLLLILNAIFIPIAIIIVALFRWILPLTCWRNACYRLMSYLPCLWVDGNDLSLNWVNKIAWDISSLDHLNRKGWYFLVSNHRSWADIFILYHVFNRKAPPLKFFLKQELIWIPIIGLACRALHFPFMKRYSKSYLKKHPEKKGKDFETTRRSCEAFKAHPSTMILFAEGTRFTQAKHDDQNSPYPCLLRPKGTILAFSLSLLGDRMKDVLDVTIQYDQPDRTLWDLLCGRVKSIRVNVTCQKVPDDILSKLDQPLALRRSVQPWLDQMWAEKSIDLTHSD